MGSPADRKKRQIRRLATKRRISALEFFDLTSVITARR
jgi:hypothetical protein